MNLQTRRSQRSVWLALALAAVLAWQQRTYDPGLVRIVGQETSSARMEP